MKTFFNTLACVAFTFAAASFLILNQVMATTNNQIGEVKGVSTVELAATTPGDGGGTTSYTLTVTKTGNGTVTASSTNIYCGTTCSSSFTSGTSVQLMAIPATGYIFSGWGGDCTVGESSTTCSVLMNANKTITAAFTQLPVYTLSVNRLGTGGGAVVSAPITNQSDINCNDALQDCTASFFANTQVTLTATPDAGSIFGGWSSNCLPTTSSNTCAITLNQQTTNPQTLWATVTATFNINPTATLTVTKSGTGSGTVFEGSTLEPGSVINCGNTCSASFLSGAQVTLTAAPAAGSTFTGWSGACSGTSTTCVLSMTTNKSATATFSSTTSSTITVTSPTTTALWDIGTTHAITWRNSDGFSNTRSVQLYTSPPGSNTVCLITNSVLDTGSYTWTIPSSLDERCKNQQILTVLRLDGSLVKGQSSIFSVRESLPDFIVSDIKIEKRVGDTQPTIYVTIKNIGTGTAGPDVILNTTIRDNNTGHAYKSGKTDNYVPGYVGDTASAEFLIPNSGGTYHFTAKVNDPTWPSESNYSNNALSKTIYYNNDDMFKISEVSPFASSYAPSSNIEFKVRGIEPDGTWTTAAEGISASGQVYTATDPYQPVLYSNYNLSDPLTGWYNISVLTPSVAGTYKMRVVLWCGFDAGKDCSDKYGSGGPQVETMVPFIVSGTGTNGTIKIINPPGGARFLIGNTYTIGWSTNGIPTSLYSAKPLLEVLDKNSNPLTFWNYDTTFAGSDDSRFGRVDFTIPSNLVDTMVKFRVTVKDANNVYTGVSGDVYFAASLPNTCATNSELIQRAALGTDEFSRSGYATAIHPEIVKYRIKWFAGSWSQWYTTGIDDVDWKTNSDSSGRRVWAYFGDHTHEYMKCNSTGHSIGAYDVGVSDITSQSALVSWKVDQLATGRVFYGLGSSANDLSFVMPITTPTTLSTTHSVNLINLLPNRTYYYKVEGHNATGDYYGTAVSSFKTLAESSSGQVKTMQAPTSGYYAFKLISYDSAASTQFIDINNSIKLTAAASLGDTQLQLASPLKVNTSYIVFNSDTDSIDQLEVSSTTACCVVANAITLSKALAGNYPVSGTYVVPLMGNYWGRFPTPEPAYNLGYFTAGQEIKVGHSSNLNYSQVGPFVPGVNTDYFYITKEGNKFTAYADEGFKIGPLDAKWEVYLTDSPVTNSYPIKFPLVKANNSGTVHPYMSQLISSVTIITPATPINPPVISSSEVLLMERIQALEYRVTELERSVVSAEKSLVTTVDPVLTSRVAGKILLQVEGKGEAWYVDKDTSKKFYLKDGDTAYAALQAFGLGITNDNLAKIPVATDTQAALVDSDGDGLDDKLEESLGTDANKADTDSDSYSDGVEVVSGYSPLGPEKLSTDTNLISRLQGKILLQVEGRGQAWYVLNGKRYYLKDGPSAYQIMRLKSLGITNTDLRKIQVGEFE